MRLPLPFSSSLRPFWPPPGLLLLGKARYSRRPSSLSRTLLTQKAQEGKVSPAPAAVQVLSVEPRSARKSDQTPAFKICLPCEPQKGLGWTETAPESEFLTDLGHSRICLGASHVHCGLAALSFPF